MSNKDIVRKLLEDAQQAALEDAKEGTPLAFGSEQSGHYEMDMTEFELYLAIEAAARVTDANHPQVTPHSSRRIKKKKAGRKQK